MTVDLTQWTVLDLAKVLEENGYESSDIIDCEFVRMNDSGQGIFLITYQEDDFGDLGHGKVYVFLNKNGRLVAEY